MVVRRSRWGKVLFVRLNFSENRVFSLFLLLFSLLEFLHICGVLFLENFCSFFFLRNEIIGSSGIVEFVSLDVLNSLLFIIGVVFHNDFQDFSVNLNFLFANNYSSFLIWRVHLVPGVAPNLLDFVTL